MPGRLLHRLSALAPRVARERVIEPLIADLPHEWIGRTRAQPQRPPAATAFAADTRGVDAVWQKLA